ncbi:MAG: hypothetical protein M3378_07225 [Actinomycetota bacterium]|nr:hypothetical protein [Actinomycetota bacterium]MDQ3680319.1 hypothetical protein [Actinomycetota bacterium]
MPETAGTRYLEHLSDGDVGLLAGFLGQGSQTVAELRSRPAAVEGLLSHPAAFDTVFAARGGEEPFLRASPFLVFALAVHRCAAELRDATNVPEWLGPRRRVTVFDVADLRGFLHEPHRRLFLVELLTSYTRVRSGSVLVYTERGWRRRRFSELDPLRLASLLDVVPEAERVGVYRRLGDVALFLTGVFPDHTATRAFSPVGEARLRRSAGLRTSDSDRTVPGGGAVTLLETLGRRWYRLASSTAPVRTDAMRVVDEIGQRFHHARRILNLVTERHLFPFRDRWTSSW